MRPLNGGTGGIFEHRGFRDVNNVKEEDALNLV